MPTGRYIFAENVRNPVSPKVPPTFTDRKVDFCPFNWPPGVGGGINDPVEVPFATRLDPRDRAHNFRLLSLASPPVPVHFTRPNSRTWPSFQRYPRSRSYWAASRFSPLRQMLRTVSYWTGKLWIEDNQEVVFQSMERCFFYLLACYLNWLTKVWVVLNIFAISIG